MLNPIKIKNKNEKKKIYLFGIPIYSKSVKNDYIKRSYFFSLIQTKTYKYKTKYYFLKLKVFQKLNIENLTLNLNNKNNLENLKALEIKLEAKLKTLIQCQSLHKETFGPYKYAFKDKTVVLVASGPTAQYHSQIDDAIYVGVNNACLLEKIKLDYLFCQDFYMDEEKRNAIVNYRPNECRKFFGRIPDDRIVECKKNAATAHVTRCPKYLIEKANAKEYYVTDDLQDKFCMDIEKEPLNAWGIVFSTMQFILHAHPSRIYLVGCDCSSGFFYKSDITFNNAPMVRGWQALKQHMEEFYPDIEIISINPVGLKGLFKDEYTDNYLESLSNEERAALNV